MVVRTMCRFRLENCGSSQLDSRIPHLCVWHVWRVQTVLTGVHPNIPNLCVWHVSCVQKVPTGVQQLNVCQTIITNVAIEATSVEALEASI